MSTGECSNRRCQPGGVTLTIPPESSCWPMVIMAMRVSPALHGVPRVALRLTVLLREELEF